MLRSSKFMSAAHAGAVLLGAVAAAGAVLCAMAPADLPELFVGVVGAIVYAAYHQKARIAPKKKSLKREVGVRAPAAKAERSFSSAKPRVPTAPKKQYRQESVAPVSEVVFQNAGWEMQVEELLQQIRPSEESNKTVQHIVRAAERSLRPLLPEADIVGCASGNIKGKRAFGVAIPEVDIVMTVSPTDLVGRLQTRLPNGAHLAKLDAKKLQKAAIRACADQLVSAGGFKFRRSAFKGEEPKFTLLAPASVASGDCTIALDFSVNAATPLHAAALFRRIATTDTRAADVILLLRRWARDRGIAHAARGHLSPYGWTLLAAYFLQTGAAEDGVSILPAMSGLSQKEATPEADAASSPRRSSAELFKQCLLFYSKFNWRNEAVSVRLGRRAPPGIALPVHVTLGDDKRTTYVAPSIEDPFNESRNIAASMGADGVKRLGGELDRASRLISQGAALSELLELWSPPEERDPADATTDAPSD